MHYGWDKKKSEELKNEGRPSFQEAVQSMAENGVLVDDENPVHAGQRLYVVMIGNYPHVVPYEVRGDVHWLITVYPARKYKR